MTLEKEQNHNEDISMFIKSQLRFEEDVDADLLRQIRLEILEKSSGIFLWVNLVVHQLNEVQRQDGRMTAVQQRLREIPEAVKKRPVPNGAMPLYSLFQDIIQKDEKNIDDLVRLTQFVFCARRSLYPEELYVLLHQTYDVPFDSSEISDKILRKHIVEVSKGLAEVTKSEEPTVQFIHETVREFLRDGGLQNICTQSVDRDGHEIMKASCLKQILAPAPNNLQLLADYRHIHRYQKPQVNKIIKPRQKEFQEQANKEFPFLGYASKNIFFHAEHAEAMGVSQCEFLGSFPIEEWIPIYNLFQKFNTRRYRGTKTPILYILAEHGCDHLIRSSPEFRGQYAREVKGNEFQSALACSIFNGNLDTAWTLVGLDAKTRPQDMRTPMKSAKYPLVQLLLILGDVNFSRKVLEDNHGLEESMEVDFNFEFVQSAEMIDLFLEVSVVPGFPLVGFRHKKARAHQKAMEHPWSSKNLIFIRQAIEENPSLLEKNVWGGEMMLDYAVKRCLRPLLSLYLDYSDGSKSDVALHCAASVGDLEMVIISHRHGANLGSQNEDGQTALHLSTLHTATVAFHETKALRYLLLNEPSCVNVRDSKGMTALHIAANMLRHPALRVQVAGLFEAFLLAGADPNTVIQCLECGKHDIPLVTFFSLYGDTANFRIVTSRDDRCDVDGRDSFGRTALSWCFSPRHRATRTVTDSDESTYKNTGLIGEQLLQYPRVNVNSRDDAGYTILEHFIRYPSVGLGFDSLVHKFFQSSRLDMNLPTSNGQNPLELIVSLYDTWPTEFGGIDSTDVLGTEISVVFIKNRTKATRQQALNQHLIQALRLLLGTGKVDIDVQRRCVEQAAPEVKRIILGSIESMF